MKANFLLKVCCNSKAGSLRGRLTTNTFVFFAKLLIHTYCHRQILGVMYIFRWTNKISDTSPIIKKFILTTASLTGTLLRLTLFMDLSLSRSFERTSSGFVRFGSSGGNSFNGVAFVMPFQPISGSTLSNHLSDCAEWYWSWKKNNS